MNHCKSCFEFCCNLCLVFEVLESAFPVKFAEEHLYPLHIQDNENLMIYLIDALLRLLLQCCFEMDVAHSKSSFCRMLALLPLLHQNIPVRLAVNKLLKEQFMYINYLNSFHLSLSTKLCLPALRGESLMNPAVLEHQICQKSNKT